MKTRFQDRTEAGKILAGLLQSYAHRADVRVLALPRGGVPVAFEVAQALHAPLDVFVVRKLGVLSGVLAAEAPSSLSVRVCGHRRRTLPRVWLSAATARSP